MAAQQRPQPGQQLRDLERLGQVVLRARVEALDPVVQRAARREHEDGRENPAGPQPGDQVDALDPGQAAIDEQHLVPARQPRVQAGLPVGGDLDGEPLPGQQLVEQLRQPAIVLDHEDPRRQDSRDVAIGRLGCGLGSHAPSVAESTGATRVRSSAPRNLT